VVLPLANEVLNSFGNVPIPVKELEKRCEELRKTFGLKSFDLSLLNNDDLWYLRQLDMESSRLKAKMIKEIESQPDRDHVEGFKKIFGDLGYREVAVETFQDVYNRIQNLKP